MCSCWHADVSILLKPCQHPSTASQSSSMAMDMFVQLVCWCIWLTVEFLFWFLIPHVWFGHHSLKDAGHFAPNLLWRREIFSSLRVSSIKTESNTPIRNAFWTQGNPLAIIIMLQPYWSVFVCLSPGSALPPPSSGAGCVSHLCLILLSRTGD